jgi:hypothetical protein
MYNELVTDGVRSEMEDEEVIMRRRRRKEKLRL